MIELGRPGVAVAGAVLALLPLALHFIARRPPGSLPLPTARFLTPERVTRVRLERRPVDLIHVFLRVLFVLTISTAFAEPSFEVNRGGVGDIVLLDVSAAMRPYAAAAVDSARAILARTEAARSALVVFDSTARRVGDAQFVLDSLAGAGDTAGVAHADLGAALDALRATAATLSAHSARAWLIFVSRGDTWPAGLGSVRESTWPGEIGVIAFEPQDSAPAPREASPVVGAAVVFASSDTSEAILKAALEALGVPVAEPTSVMTSNTAAVAFRAPPSAFPVLRQALDAGATVVLGPETHGSVPGVEPIWTPAQRETVAPHPIVRFVDGLVVRGASVQAGRAAAGVIWLAATGDGEPAAVAAPIGSGCLVTAAFDPVSLLGSDPGSVPDVLERLLRGCKPADPRLDGVLPLDGGALAVLRGAPPGAVALGPLRESAPDPNLVRGLLLLALTAACVEAYLSYGPARAKQMTGAATE